GSHSIPPVAGKHGLAESGGLAGIHPRCLKVQGTHVLEVQRVSSSQGMPLLSQHTEETLAHESSDSPSRTPGSPMCM
ncbi:hypothetical protein P7K49_009967, partial [Saguinus oedipus]